MSDTHIKEVLQFWFADRDLDGPALDNRMDCWFGNNPEFDAELAERFKDLTVLALTGKLDGWAASPQGMLALILLLEQFPRRIYKDRPEAFRGDRRALKLCEHGVSTDSYRKLNALQQMFFFMPLQRAESIKVQQTSVKIYKALAARVSATLHDAFDTVAQFAELRRDIIEEFGRFPHRNQLLGRANTGDEEACLSV